MVDRPPRPESELEAVLERTFATSPATPEAGGQGMTQAFARFRWERRRRVALGTAACGLLVAGVLWWARAPDAPSGPDRSNPRVYAKWLHDRVFGPTSNTSDEDRQLLQRDPAARAEHLAALDHPSGLVRRMAANTLAACGVPIPADKLTALLIEFREYLDDPILVAGVGDDQRTATDALRLNRSATMFTMLEAALVMAASGHPTVPESAVLPYLTHADGRLRESALRFLEHHDGYVPDAQIANLLRNDSDQSVRVAAADVLVATGGQAGLLTVLEFFRTLQDPPLEGILVGGLKEADGFEAVLRAKLARPDLDADLALILSGHLVALGDPEPARTWLARVLPTMSGPALVRAFHLAGTLGEVETMDLALAQTARLTASERRSLAKAMLRPTLESGDLERIRPLLKRFVADCPARDAHLLEYHAEHSDPAVRALLQAAIEALQSSGAPK
ncbi:MAG: hypothetical protein O2894_13900 [Planctomycetota bacterium]|nr:hypothetical protein [Planctomycetota bacterium]